MEEKGINDKAILNAMGTVPRHLFMDSGLNEHSYLDKAYPIGANQTISQPYTVAIQTQLLELKKGIGFWRLEQDLVIKQLFYLP